jgi:putative ABC transport system substrate-binding protein
MTKRRDLLLALSACGAAPYVKAQQPSAGRRKRIGLISDQPSKLPATEMPGWKPFLSALSGKGWTLGKNLEFGPEYREKDPHRLAALAKKLVLDGVDLILSINEEPTLAAARATRSIPILFFSVAWPLELGLIDSFARSGRNVTGIASDQGGLEMRYKRVEYLRQVAPDAKRLSWIQGEPSWSYETLAGGRWNYSVALDPNIKRLGFEPSYHLAPTPQDIDTAFAEVAASRAQVLVAGGSSIFYVKERMAELALQQRLPSAVQYREAVEAGMLLSIAVTSAEEAAMNVRAAGLADRLLRDENAADLPVEQPSRYELVINMKTAKALGITIPQALLIRADEVIQ